MIPEEARFAYIKISMPKNWLQYICDLIRALFMIRIVIYHMVLQGLHVQLYAFCDVFTAVSQRFSKPRVRIYHGHHCDCFIFSR
jgi:hypothetical protein